MEGIGFGCVRLTSNYSERSALRNLETAYEEGIRHFDVARSYGYGLAEGILGKFLKGKRDRVTITSKFGIFPNNGLLKSLWMQNLARDMFHFSKKFAVGGRVSRQLAGHAITKNFDLTTVQNSMETSLRALGTDHIDFYLLHEGTVKDARNEDLRAFLELQKQKGLIGAYGLGSFRKQWMPDFSKLPSAYTVLQTDNSYPYEAPDLHLMSTQISKRFYFSPLRYLSKIQQAIKEYKSFVEEMPGIRLVNPDQLLDFFLIHQYVSDPQGTFLFTSSKNDKIKDMVRRWQRVISVPVENYSEMESLRLYLKSLLEREAITA
jgi:D-threo-aldose 1-dehydrogenase